VTTEQLAGGQTVEEPTGAVWGTAAPGKGGWVRFGIEGNRSLEEIRLLPGRTDTLTSFTEYGRPKTLEVTLSDGTSTVVTLEDEPALQRFAVAGTAEWVRFDILDIYPGSKTDDTYLTQVDFGNAPAPEFETFSSLLAEGAPPTTTPSTSSSTSGAEPVFTTIYPTTTSVFATAIGSVTASTAMDDPVRDRQQSRRLLWPAIVGVAVAALALGVLVSLVVRLRRGRSQGGV
jgi:hypothetical protein